MGVTGCILCAHLDKSLKSRLNVMSGLCKTHCQQAPEFSCQFLVHTYNFLQCQPKRLKWVVLFGHSFLGPLLQHSPWIDHLLWGQIQEACFYNKTPNLARSILAQKLVWPTTNCTDNCTNNCTDKCTLDFLYYSGQTQIFRPPDTQDCFPQN